MAEKISTMISSQEVADRIAGLAAEISEAYRGKVLHLICVLKGGAFFMTELSKHPGFYGGFKLWGWDDEQQECENYKGFG